MAQQVRGVVARSKGAPVTIETIVIPDPGPGEAVVKVQACGVCHTDLHYREGGINDEFPFLLGHEAAGVVESIGAGVTQVAPGDFVILNWRAVCGECRACKRGRPWYCFNTFNATQKMTLTDGTELTPALGVGAFADKTLVHQGQCTKVDDEADAAVAGLLGCGVMAGIGAAINTGNVGRGDSVAVFGCGGVGLSIIMIAVARGARVVAVDVAPGALAMAESLGADAAIRSASGFDLAGALRELLPTGVDATFDALGSIDTCRTAVESLRPRGRHVQVGLLPPAEVGDRASVPMHRVIGLELSIRGSHGMSARSYPEMLSLMAQGHLDPSRLITRMLTLDEAPAALQTMASNPHPGVSVIHPFAATA